MESKVKVKADHFSGNICIDVENNQKIYFDISDADRVVSEIKESTQAILDCNPELRKENEEMAKLVSSTGEELNSVNVPNVVGVTPGATQVLYELLTMQEMLGTSLHVRNSEPDKHMCRQAYVLALGCKVTEADWGFKVGDRVLFSGEGVKVPNYDDSHREKILSEPHSVRGVLTEA